MAGAPLTNLAEFLLSIHTREPVAGLTHEFYCYPARFSPLFARAAITIFSKPGDVVLDPFMGGGTTLVEALSLGRRALGTDINPLAAFVAEVKTTPLSESDLRSVRKWAGSLTGRLNLQLPPIRAQEWSKAGYQRHVPWPIRKTMEFILARVSELQNARQQRFARCALLKATQWAIDIRKVIPSATDFRCRFFECLEEMSQGMRAFSKAIKKASRWSESCGEVLCLCLNRSAIGLETAPEMASLEKKPNLVVTSPPYPGVHVVYHRWQVHGRRETPAPFWVAHSLDGNGESFYTFVSRKRMDLSGYFERAYEAFSSVRALIDDGGVVVQMVAFSDPSWQLSRYLNIMSDAGFKEVSLKELAGEGSQRIWRNVPNRKWYAHQRGSTAASKEVVLFHKPR